ncbi:MAG TPA: LpqB family beta-propeller domain-containing protein [bacterium]|nr:LpqB family beta-propeller domain-containing protein [bacterium]
MRVLVTIALVALVVSAGAAARPAAKGELAFTGADHGVPQVFVIGADGSERRRLTDAPAGSTTPVWSPDGQQIAFVRRSGGNSQLYITDARGGSLRALTSGAGRAASPSWSPDGRQIVFAAARDGPSQIAIVRSDGGGRRNLAPSPRDQVAPAWSPDGHLIAFLTKASAGYLELYVAGADGRNLRQVPTPVPSLQPDVTEFVWLPDGRLAYTNRSGLAQEGLTVTTVSGAERRYLGSASSPAWSPDGRQLAFVVGHAGAPEIYVRNGDAKPVRLVDPSLTPVRPAWSPDGRQIAFLLLGGGTVVLAVMDADGGHLKRLAGNVYGDLSARPVFSWRPK